MYLFAFNVFEEVSYRTWPAKSNYNHGFENFTNTQGCSIHRELDSWTTFLILEDGAEQGFGVAGSNIQILWGCKVKTKYLIMEGG